jgi:hypothetical protein
MPIMSASKSHHPHAFTLQPHPSVGIVLGRHRTSYSANGIRGRD